MINTPTINTPKHTNKPPDEDKVQLICFQVNTLCILQILDNFFNIKWLDLSSRLELLENKCGEYSCKAL